MKIHSLNLLADISAELRAAGKRVVLAHGCFDIPHVGHMAHLEAAKRLGDVLMVTVTPDRFVNKGPGRPVFPEHLRAIALASLGAVDYVAVNRWATAVDTIELLRPAFYVKGQEFRGKMTAALNAEEDAVLCVGGELVFTDEPEFHSTDLLNKVLAHG